MWTLTDLEAKASREPGFSFYTEQHPNYRGRAYDLLTSVPKVELTDEQQQQLKRQVIEFKSGFYHTTNYLVAFVLLNAPAHMAITPGVWANKEPQAEALEKEAKAATPKKPRSKKK